MDQSESNQSNQNHHEYIQDNHESDYNYENDQSYQYDYESNQNGFNLTKSLNGYFVNIVNVTINQTLLEQHKDAIRLDAAEKTVNKELEQLTEKNKNHIIGIAKIVYTLVQQDIPLAKLLYMVQLSHELESLFICICNDWM
ncbi:1221_t:CDS:2 [Scutellospora calospora]|uniref:1221_t:CDS:1 n=1 Tax=Scutellospora calospora TaxID=85575 RepID=A0ACA9LCG4_9GLOM|nr:1221_t:CDS:2 [Scutellospora calospora]